MAWKLTVQFRAVGTPRPGGSKTLGYSKASGRHFIRESCKKNPIWRQDVKAAAIGVLEPGTPLLDGCLRLDVLFLLPRPKGHFGTGRNAGLVKASAPPFPNVMPDTTKLLRSTEDALTGIVWVDDARITDQHAQKRYCESYAPGAVISVSVWEAEELTKEMQC